LDGRAVINKNVSGKILISVSALAAVAPGPSGDIT
jgi:hypothetical protein